MNSVIAEAAYSRLLSSASVMILAYTGDDGGVAEASHRGHSRALI